MHFGGITHAMQVPLIALSVWTAPAPQSQDVIETTERSVTVTVTVVDQGGNPIAQAPFQVETSKGIERGLTDQRGIVEVPAKVSGQTESIRVRLTMIAAPGSPAETAELVRTRYLALKSQFAFDSVYRIELKPAEPKTELTITVWPAITVSGTLIDPDGNPILRSREGLAVRPGGTSATKSDANAKFVLGGFRKGAAGEVFLGYNPCVMAFAARHLAANETGANLDLGGVVMPRVTCTVPVDIKLVNTPERLRHEFDSNPGGVTLVPADADGLIIMLIVRDGSAVLNYNTNDPPLIPPGEYWIAPGLFLGTPGQMSLIAAMRSGADLAAAGITKLDAIEGHIATASVDAIASELALRKLAEQARAKEAQQ